MKKNTLYIFVATFFILLLSGCGGGGGGGDTSSNLVSQPTTMSVGSSYILKSSSVIERTSTDANISIVTNIDTNETIVILNSGGATCAQCSVQ